MNWQNSLVILTADHGNSMLRFNPAALEELHREKRLPQQTWRDTLLPNQKFDNGEWQYEKTKDGKPIIRYHTSQHTNEPVVLAARGANARAIFSSLAKQNAVCGRGQKGPFVDNTQIHRAMKQAVEKHGVKHIVLIVGDGMHIAHEKAYSILKTGKPDQLSWYQWHNTEGDQGFLGRATTWDISAYDWHACRHRQAPFNPQNCDNTLGFDKTMFNPDFETNITKTPTQWRAYYLAMPPRPRPE